MRRWKLKNLTITEKFKEKKGVGDRKISEWTNQMAQEYKER